MTTGTDLPDFVTYKIYINDKVNSILSATLQHLDSEQIIALRDSLIERTPPKPSVLPKDIIKKIEEKYPTQFTDKLGIDYSAKDPIGQQEAALYGYSICLEEKKKLVNKIRDCASTSRSLIVSIKSLTEELDRLKEENERLRGELDRLDDGFSNVLIS